MSQMLDISFEGLLSPRNVFCIGRPDLVGDRRPGAALLALVADFAREGGFKYEAVSDPGFHGAPTLSVSEDVGNTRRRNRNFDEDVQEFDVDL